MPTLLHENDGVILTPVMKPYTIGTTNELLKWKPGNLNSVDFLLQVEENKPRPGELKEKVGKLFVGGLDQPYAVVRATKKIRDLHRRIVECVWKEGSWDVIRVREDKSFPNSYQTAQGVVESIKHPVTKEGLLHFVEKFGWRVPPALNGDQKLMPPPARGMPLLKKKPTNT
jgi:mRNA-capping enzyme